MIKQTSVIYNITKRCQTVNVDPGRTVPHRPRVYRGDTWYGEWMRCQPIGADPLVERAFTVALRAWRSLCCRDRSDVLKYFFVWTMIGFLFCALCGFPRFPFLFSCSRCNSIWFKVNGHDLEYHHDVRPYILVATDQSIPIYQLWLRLEHIGVLERFPYMRMWHDDDETWPDRRVSGESACFHHTEY